MLPFSRLATHSPHISEKATASILLVEGLGNTFRRIAVTAQPDQTRRCRELKHRNVIFALREKSNFINHVKLETFTTLLLYLAVLFKIRPRRLIINCVYKSFLSQFWELFGVSLNCPEDGSSTLPRIDKESYQRRLKYSLKLSDNLHAIQVKQPNGNERNTKYWQ
jgi:hypothetical protein